MKKILIVLFLFANVFSANGSTQQNSVSGVISDEDAKKIALAVVAMGAGTAAKVAGPTILTVGGGLSLGGIGAVFAGGVVTGWFIRNWFFGSPKDVLRRADLDASEGRLAKKIDTITGVITGSEQRVTQEIKSSQAQTETLLSRLASSDQVLGLKDLITTHYGETKHRLNRITVNAWNVARSIDKIPDLNRDMRNLLLKMRSHIAVMNCDKANRDSQHQQLSGIATQLLQFSTAIDARLTGSHETLSSNHALFASIASGLGTVNAHLDNMTKGQKLNVQELELKLKEIDLALKKAEASETRIQTLISRVGSSSPLS